MSMLLPIQHIPGNPLVLILTMALPAFAAEVPPPQAPAVGAHLHEHEDVQTPELHRGEQCVYCYSIATHQRIIDQYLQYPNGSPRMVKWLVIVCETCGYQHYKEVLYDGPPIQ